MKSHVLFFYFSICLLNKAMYALNIEDINSSIDTNTRNIDLRNISGILTNSVNLFSEFQCSSKVTDCEDIHLPFPKLVKKHGYSVEEHEVETSDGYLLTMFRMPNKGPAVLLIHGMPLSSDEFVTIGPQAGLAYQLADAGYDVWLANCRGTKYSMRHVSLSTDSAAYWDFSSDEYGLYDIPAMIDYILNATNAKDVKVIAYSYGTNSILTLCSEKPEYNDKISAITLLSPTVFEKNLKSPIIKLLSRPIAPDFYLLAKSIGIYSLFTDMEIGPIVDLLKGIFCATPETASAFCHNLLFLLYGSDYGQVNKTSLPVIYGHFPTSTSIKALQHFLQIAKSGKFRRYDNGKELNLIKYGSPQPPEIRIDKIKTKVAICWAANDQLCAEEDLQTLLDKLPNVIHVYKVPLEEFSHADFVFARDVKSLLYDKVLEILDLN